MKIRLAYGKSGLEVDIPDGNLRKVMTMEGSTPLADANASLAASFEHPIESAPLRELRAGLDQDPRMLPASGARTSCAMVGFLSNG